MFEVNQRIDPAAELPELTAAIAALPAPRPGGTAAAAGSRVRALLMLRRRLDHQLLAELACFDGQGFGDAYGFASTAAWLRAVGYLDPGQAARMVGSARTTTVLPLLAAELAAGRIGVEHVEAVSRETRHVPNDEVAVHDKTLRDLTIYARPADLARAGRAITEVYRHDLAEEDRERLRDARRLSIARTFDGLWHVDGLLPADVGAQLIAVTDAFARKGGPEDERTPTQRRADALAEVLDTALRLAPLPDVGGERPRLTVIVQADTTAVCHPSTGVNAGTGCGGAGTGTGTGTGTTAEPLQLAVDLAGRRGLGQAMIASGSVLAGFSAGSAANLVGCPDALSPETLARLSCDAEINVALVNRGGDVLNLGLSSRFPNLAQRRALVVRDGGCVFPGCDRPPSACQAHHLRFWSRQGRTDMDNLALVCHYHHHLIHEDHWVLQRVAPSADVPFGGWQASSPTGLELHEFRQPAA